MTEAVYIYGRYTANKRNDRREKNRLEYEFGETKEKRKAQHTLTVPSICTGRSGTSHKVDFVRNGLRYSIRNYNNQPMSILVWQKKESSHLFLLLYRRSTEGPPIADSFSWYSSSVRYLGPRVHKRFSEAQFRFAPWMSVTRSNR
jgi:hypothetical protein